MLKGYLTLVTKQSYNKAVDLQISEVFLTTKMVQDVYLMRQKQAIWRLLENTSYWNWKVFSSDGVISTVRTEKSSSKAKILHNHMIQLNS